MKGGCHLIETVILAIVCVILVLILYVVTGGWRKYRGVRGFFQWIREGMTTSNGFASGASRRKTGEHSSSADAGVAEAIAVLRDMYTEFDEKYHDLAKRIDQLEQMLGTWMHDQPSVVKTLDEVSAANSTEAMGTEQETIDEGNSLRVTSDSGSEAVYFSILDMLNSGATYAQIRAQLGVTDEQIEVVKSLLAGGPSQRKD
ncbi:hypothetical protein SD51_08355 [Alicyclobacillus tengchongensis]|nr:hypothetical protein SD51_08355 [Alicyclobacillus tengchongensis]